MSTNKNYYESLNGIRGYACFGIVIMHVLANGDYNLPGIIFNKVIPELKDLVFLFMLVSGFATCCGYFERMVKKEFSSEQFYKRRYEKIWPFFALLVMADLIMSPSIDSLYEAFADLTLCFGLLPESGGGISVIGVGWFLGVVFVYYLLFPFTCFLLSDKKRAWVSLIVSIIFSYISKIYFEAERTNIIFCAPFFLMGGGLYLYKEDIKLFSKKYRAWVILSILILIPVYYLFTTNITSLLLFTSFVVLALGIDKRGILINRATSLLSSVSLEIYLCHMLVFRLFEKFDFVHLIKGNELLSYIVCSIGVFIGALVMAVLYQKGLDFLKRFHQGRVSQK